MKTHVLYLLTIGLMTICGLALASDAFAKRGGAGSIEMMDANSDGKVTPEEHAAGAKKMFDMMDVDKDGKVTAGEMDAAYEQMMGKKAGKARMSAAEKIKTCDTNEDGALAADEHTTCAKRMFEKMDTNQNGTLNKAEMRAGHAKMMRKRSSK